MQIHLERVLDICAVGVDERFSPLPNEVPIQQFIDEAIYVLIAAEEYVWGKVERVSSRSDAPAKASDLAIPLQHSVAATHMVGSTQAREACADYELHYSQLA